MTRANILIAVAVAVITISFWGYLNRPEQEPPWPERIQGFSFSPLREGQSSIDHILPSEAEIEADLALLAGKTNAVRSYTLEGPLEKIPALARKYGINVALGAWINADSENNEAEIDKLIKTAKENYRNVVRVIVGNEALLREEIKIDQLVEYLDQVREALPMPVSTAEPWHVWIKYPELAQHVDYLAVHMLPFWEGIDVDRAVDYIVDHINLLRTRFPDKPIVIAEVGWPSNGRTRHSAVASVSNQAAFLRRFLDRAAKEKYIYYVMEAFDQPWKRGSEGAVGAYWGVYDVYRQPKFPFSEPLVDIPEWRILASISVGIAIITFALLLIDSQTLTTRGRSFLATIAFIASTPAVWIVYSFTKQYMTLSTLMVGLLMTIGLIGVVVVLLAEAHEWAEAIFVARRRRPFTPVQVPDGELPMVSVHVPAYNEPPEMLMETLNALAASDYPMFEVLVIDNNTKDPAVWQPVEAHCQKLGPRFRFFHVDPLAGFKAGALNFALAHTAPAATVIAVIDSDYMVTPDWLRDLAPQFARPGMAIVQAPQDYRDESENLFKAMCYSEYRGFFYIGMLTRNERNAIIQHGTMTMVRRTVLEEVNGWAEWCITEDAELGLRIFEKGYEATYIPRSYGRGVMPDTYIDFKKQRFRWAYGSIQIMRRHAASLLGFGKTKLTWGQRYHFIAGWLPWIADSINLIFTLGAVFWSVAMILAPKQVDPPLLTLSVLPLTLFIFKSAKMFFLYRNRVSATVSQTLAAAAAGLSLSHTIAKAVLNGFVTKNKPFFRTPKMVGANALIQALVSSREEFLVMSALWLAAAVIARGHRTETPDHLVWILFLLIQSVPYLAAVFMSLLSGLTRMPKTLINRMTESPDRI